MSWWRCLEDDCPLSLFPLNKLPHEPFGLMSAAKGDKARGVWGAEAKAATTTANRSCDPIIHWFDGAHLAVAVISLRSLVHPLTRRPLGRGECISLDEYLSALGFPAVDVAKAFDKARAAKPGPDPDDDKKGLRVKELMRVALARLEAGDGDASDDCGSCATDMDWGEWLCQQEGAANWEECLANRNFGANARGECLGAQAAQAAQDAEATNEFPASGSHSAADEHLADSSHVDSDAAEARTGGSPPDADHVISQVAQLADRFNHLPSSHRFQGSIAFYNVQESYGFISCGEFPRDVWFSKADLPAKYQKCVCKGDIVSFSIFTGPYDGNLQARQVVLERKQEPLPVTGGERSGQIINYSSKNGFGFISCADSDLNCDVWFAIEELPSTQRSRHLGGLPVKFQLHWSPQRQPQARSISVLAEQQPREDGRVVSFSAWKGFGFITCTSKKVDADVWFAKEELPEKYQSDGALKRGTVITFRLDIRKDGKPKAHDIKIEPS